MNIYEFMRSQGDRCTFFSSTSFSLPPESRQREKKTSGADGARGGCRGGRRGRKEEKMRKKKGERGAREESDPPLEW